MLFANRTRRSQSIPRRIVAERKFHLLPMYAVLRCSDLAREAMANSGSYRFADHIYADRASGRLLVGKLLDRVLLSLPSARSFRNRYLHVRSTLRAFLAGASGTVRVLSVPSGIPRDLVDVAAELRVDNATFFIVDLDPEVLQQAMRFAEDAGVGALFVPLRADAMREDALPAGMDFIASTGFAEFLSDEQTLDFYRRCRESLAPAGIFVTSSTIRHSLSAWMMEELAELDAHYRDEAATESLLRAAGFKTLAIARDPVGYQVLVTASL